MIAETCKMYGTKICVCEQGLQTEVRMEDYYAKRSRKKISVIT